MGLLSGSASVTRFNVLSRPEEPDFELGAFREIPRGTEVRERAGFVPFEPEAPYRVGQNRLAFRVRIDTLRPDPTRVKERLKELEKTEKDATGAGFVPSKKRRRLRELAEEEMLSQAAPTSRVIECCLEDRVLYVGTTANTHLGLVLGLARLVGIDATFKAPWIDRDEPEASSPLVEAAGPGQSVLGCRFLRVLLADSDLVYEPETGSVALRAPDARVTLAGAVIPEVHRYVDRGAEILSAKLLMDDVSFRLDGLSFRVGALRIETERFDSWIEQLDARLERIVAVYDVLDAKYAELSASLQAMEA